MQALLTPLLSNSSLIELHFLPSIEYFCALQSRDNIVIEKHENFTKQSFRNRCYILAANGVERLTVPLIADHRKVVITDVKIDHSIKWQITLWRTLESAYAKSPFFEHYSDDIRKELFFPQTYLYDLNMRLLSMCLQWLKWNKTLSESVTYEKTMPTGVTDLRSVISAKKDFQLREIYQPSPYQQVFGSNFAPNLSLIDLVFCEGPAAAAIIKASQRN
ncbi:MAG: WbqC family protein [Bacteroidota bacterium]